MSFGFKVGTAVDGEEALAQLHAAHDEGQPYELVLMDWNWTARPQVLKRL